MSTRRTSGGFWAKTAIIVAMVLASQSSFPQNGDTQNVITDLAKLLTENTNKILKKTEGAIEKYLDAKDSLYITPNLYNLTVMPQYSYYFEYYRFTSGKSGQGITLMPRISSKVGLYIGWRWLFFGYNFNLDKGAPEKDFNFSFYTSKLGIDLFYRNRDKGYRIRDTRGFTKEAEAYTSRNKNFNGLTIRQIGFNIYYIFNNKKFSYPAAYSQTTTQRISAGSFILGINYNEQSFTFDYSQFSPIVEEQLVPELKFKNIKYKDFCINLGYSYNWVFARNYLANISLTPGVGYKNTSLRLENSRDILSNINFDLVTRAGIVYNNSKYFAGASLVSHTYTYRKEAISLLNGFGVINIYFGAYFWKKKAKR
ncbi:MAG: DUF4421 domain-containing protein [Bacteroidaceae bacterium]|nr:DUF4421 domain-containing protein [Bacteroidaceae bacterium]